MESSSEEQKLLPSRSRHKYDEEEESVCWESSAHVLCWESSATGYMMAGMYIFLLGSVVYFAESLYEVVSDVSSVTLWLYAVSAFLFTVGSALFARDFHDPSTSVYEVDVVAGAWIFLVATLLMTVAGAYLLALGQGTYWNFLLNVLFLVGAALFLYASYPGTTADDTQQLAMQWIQGSWFFVLLAAVYVADCAYDTVLEPLFIEYLDLTVAVLFLVASLLFLTGAYAANHDLQRQGSSSFFPPTK